jgi:fluoroacetyl-CoA thioesterase
VTLRTMTNAAPRMGLRHSQTITIDTVLTVPALPRALADFSDMPPVLATAYMVGLVEATCVVALKPYLAPGQRTVGTHIDMNHSAATPIGMTVTAEVELIEVDGRRLRFRVSCRDDAEVIGEGFHERFIIDFGRFMTRVEGKKSRL